MKQYVITLAALAAAFVGSNVGAQDSLAQLLNEVKKARNEMSAENKEREQRFQRERDNQQDDARAQYQQRQ